MSSVSARLERLPFGRFQFKILLMGGVGYMFEAVDAAIVAFILPALRQQWALDSIQTGLLGSSTYVGFFFGALIAGTIGDRYGRRNVMMWALAAFCICSLASAFIQDWHGFFVLRVLGGVGMGAEAAIIAPFLSEFISSKKRGSFTASLAGFFSFGFVVAALIGRFIVPINEDGWRYALVICALPVVFVLWWRRSLYESPRWLESRGRKDEANAIVTIIEKKYYTDHGIELATPQDVKHIQAPAPQSFIDNFKILFSPQLRRVTIMTWALWLSVIFCTYAFFIWIPSLLVDRGMTITQSFSVSIWIYVAQIPGYFSAAWLCEKWGRQYTIVVYMLIAALSGIGLALAQTDVMVIAMSIILSFFINGVNAGEYAYTPEVFPTRVRATGVGLASAIGRIGAIAAPTLVGFIYPIAGLFGVFGMTTTILILGALAVIFLGVPTKGRSLEEIEDAEFLNDNRQNEGA